MLFEQATRLKLRFKTAHGVVSTEDLWDMPLGHLDTLAVALNRQIKEEAGATSFITPPEPKSDELALRFQVVKHVLDTKLAERNAAKLAQENAAKKQQFMEVLARKENAALESKTPEELKAMIDSLG